VDDDDAPGAGVAAPAAEPAVADDQAPLPPDAADDQPPLPPAAAEVSESVDDPEPPPVEDRRVWWSLLGLTVVGFVLRLADLGGRPLHHDESIDANFSKKFIEGTYEGYDPVYHGPIRFFIEGGFFKLFGETPTAARLLSALSGTLLIMLPWCWRRYLGTAGTIGASAFLCVSPSFLYFTRFGREDAFFALLTLGFFIAVLALVRRSDPRLPLVAGVLLVCAWALKESVLINVMIMGGFLLVLLVQQFLVAARRAQDPDVGSQDLLGLRRGVLFGGMGLFLFTFTYGERAATWVRGADASFICDPPKELSPHSLGWAVGLLVVVLVLAVVVAGAIARSRGVPLASVPMLRSIAGAGLVPWIAAIGVSGLLFTGLFTTFFTDLDGEPPRATVDECDADTVNDTNPTRWSGVVDGLIGGFEYWAGEQETLRGDDRWFYYLVLIPAYEWFAVLLAFVGLGRCIKRMTVLYQALAFWALVAVAAYSYAGERMPWLIIHPMLPIVMLAGIGLQVLWENRREVVAIPATALGVFGVAYTLYASFAVSYHRGADPREMFVQAAQASQDVPAELDRLGDLDRISWAERGQGIRVGLSDDVYWLWWFYMVDPSGPDGVFTVLKADDPNSTVDTTLDVIMVSNENNREDIGLIEATGNYQCREFVHRVWWSEVTDWSDGGVGGWIRWLWDRRTWTEPGGLDGYICTSNQLAGLEARAGRAP
jgi:uncharacterized protein (TIGR03663 family)